MYSSKLQVKSGLSDWIKMDPVPAEKKKKKSTPVGVFDADAAR